MPFNGLAIYDNFEGIGEDVVIMDELAIGATRAIGDAPAEGLLGTGRISERQ